MQEKPNPEAYRPPFDKPLTDEEQRAMMRDLVIGPNMRFRDNLYQAIFTLLAGAVGAGLGYFLYESFGLLFGLALGLFGGLLLSGIFIMIFRAIRHLGGHHE